MQMAPTTVMAASLWAIGRFENSLSIIRPGKRRRAVFPARWSMIGEAQTRVEVLITELRYPVCDVLMKGAL
jgi:hypothetical protein